MPMFRMKTVETTTYYYYVEAENEDDAVDNFEPCEGGKEICHHYELVEVKEENND